MRLQNAGESEIAVRVCVFLFDLLYWNGRSLLRESYRTRRTLLREHFQSGEGDSFKLANSLDSTDTDEIMLFLEEAIKGE